MALMRVACLLSAGVLLLTPPASHASRARPVWDAGPLGSKVEDARGSERLRVLGPFFEQAASTQAWTMTAARPFYSTFERPSEEVEGDDILWPLVSLRSRENEQLDRYLIFFHFRHDDPAPATGKRRYRFWLLPFYFEGRDAQGELYRANFPLGGTIREFIGQDEIRFWLWPVHQRTRVGDVKGEAWLWPFFSRATGDHIERWRLFPLYGRSERTNEFRKRFVLWPFWTDVNYLYPGSSGKGHILFPLYGHLKLEDQETWWVIPPLIRFTRGEKMDVTYAPWPFYQRQVGEGIDKRYVWPLWGHKRMGPLDRTFWLWPIVWNDRVTRSPEELHRVMVVPFVRTLSVGVTGEVPRVRAHKVWPLYSHRRVGEESLTRFPELWPFADAAAVERNWAPFWSLFLRNRQGDNRDLEVLWGLYRSQVREDGGRYWSLFPLMERYREPGGARGWSLLKGLLGRDGAESQSRWRLLYFLRWGAKDAPEKEQP